MLPGKLDTYICFQSPNKVLNKVEPLPEKPAVLSYWNDKREEFYNYSLIFKLADAFPEITFKIIGATGANLNPPLNVQFFGYQKDVLSYILNSTVYIRLVPHDGQSMMATEVLSMGRYVLYNHRTPNCEYASTFEELKSKLAEILNRKDPNYEGAKYVQKELSPKNNIQKLIKLYEKILS